MVCAKTSLRTRVAERIKQLRRERATFEAKLPAASLLLDPKLPAYVDVAPARVRGKLGERVLIALTTPKCLRACTMCGFKNASLQNVTREDLDAQLASSLGLALARIGKNVPVRVSLCTSSSTFNPGIPAGFWEDAIQTVGRDSRVLEVDVEARAGEIEPNIEQLSRFQSILGSDKNLLVGIGLETLDDFIRNSIIRKMLSLETFERAVRALGSAGVGAFAYVLLKPPGLSEREAVCECVKTISYFFNLAKQAKVPLCRVTLKPLFIAKGTILEQLHSEGLASPPSLWSLVEVLKRTHCLGTIFSPRTDENLSDGRAAKNCPECTLRVHESIHAFNRNCDVRSLEVEPCECKENQPEAII